MLTNLYMKYLLIGIFAFIMSSCVYEKMTHLDSDDMEWINVYEPKDTSIFCSDRQNIDTLIVLSKTIENSQCPFYFDTYSTEYLASGCIGYYLYGTRDSIHGIVWFDKFHNDTTVVQSFRLGHFSSLLFNYNIPMPRKVYSLSVDNTTYDNCIVIDTICANWDRYYIPDSTDISKFVWSKEHGLIMYEQINGETFSLVKQLGY